MADKYNDTGRRLKQRKLNVPELIKGRALRITEEGPGRRCDSEGPKSPACRPNAPAVKLKDPNRFSIVTPMNTQAKNWPDKPKSYKVAAKSINKMPLNDGKYRQIVDSAKKLKMPEDKIFKDDSRATRKR